MVKAKGNTTSVGDGGAGLVPRKAKVSEETSTDRAAGGAQVTSEPLTGEAKTKANRSRKPSRTSRIPAHAVQRQISIRLAEGFFPLIQQCIDESPIEFSTYAEFIKRAVENELRQRKKITTYRG